MDTYQLTRRAKTPTQRTRTTTTGPKTLQSLHRAYTLVASVSAETPTTSRALEGQKVPKLYEPRR